jgi:hypothetical protein
MKPKTCKSNLLSCRPCVHWPFVTDGDMFFFFQLEKQRQTKNVIGNIRWEFVGQGTIRMWVQPQHITDLINPWELQAYKAHNCDAARQE